MADNFHMDVTGASLEKCMDMALHASASGKLVGWRDDKDENRLVLYSMHSDAATPLPAPLISVAQVTSLVQSWLDSAIYPPKPDIDGDCEKGWRVYTESWGHINHEYQTFAAIEPVWLMYGK